MSVFCVLFSDATHRFGLLRVRSPLLTEYLLVSTPPGTEMFYFPGYARAKRGKRNIPKHSTQSPNKAQCPKTQTKKCLWSLDCFVFCLPHSELCSAIRGLGFCVCLCFVFVSPSHSPWCGRFWYSKFDWSNGLSTYLDHPELYPQKERTTLALKLFRREPAITRFD